MEEKERVTHVHTHEPTEDEAGQPSILHHLAGHSLVSPRNGRTSKRGCQDISPIGPLSLMWLAGANLVCETEERAGASALTNSMMRTAALCLQTAMAE